MTTSKKFDEIIDNLYKFTKEELRQKIVKIQSEIDKKKQKHRDLLEYKLNTLLIILGQY